MRILLKVLVIGWALSQLTACASLGDKCRAQTQAAHDKTAFQSEDEAVSYFNACVAENSQPSGFMKALGVLGAISAIKDANATHNYQSYKIGNTTYVNGH